LKKLSNDLKPYSPEEKNELAKDIPTFNNEFSHARIII